MTLRQMFARLFGRKRAAPQSDMRASVAMAWNNAEARASQQTEKFPRFLANANDHLSAYANGRFARQRLALLDVFSPSRPVSDRKRFAGRLDVLSSLIRAIEEQRLHVVMYGARGVGKTSLLHVLTQSAREARYLVVYVSCGSDSNFDEVFRTVAAAIPMLYHGGIGPTSPDVEKGKTLADILPSTPISARSASDLLANIVGTRVVVVLDEFDRSESKLFRRDVAELIKNLSDRSVRVQLVIAGVAADLKELLEHTPSIQRNIFALRVPWMEAVEVRELVKKGADACGLGFNEVAANTIVSASKGSPFLASLVTHKAGLHALDSGRTQVVAADAIEAINSAVEDFGSRLSTHIQTQLFKFDHEGFTRALGTLGAVALKGGGVFRVEDIRGSQAGLDANVRAEHLIKPLLAEELLVVCEVNGTEGFRFVEDGIAPYVWFKMALAQHLAETSPPPVAHVMPGD